MILWRSGGKGSLNEWINESQGCLENSPGYTGSVKQTVRDSLQLGRPILPEADPSLDLLLPFHQLTHIQPQPVSSLGHHPAPDPAWVFIKLGIYYFHTQNKIYKKKIVFLSCLSLKRIYALSRTIHNLKNTTPDKKLDMGGNGVKKTESKNSGALFFFTQFPPMSGTLFFPSTYTGKCSQLTVCNF